MADNVACEQGGSQYSVVGVNVGRKFIGGDSRFQSSGEVAPSNCSDTGTAAVKIAPSGSFSARHARRGPSGIGLWRRRAGLHLSNANDLGKWVPSGGFLGFTIKAEDATTCVCAATTPDSNYHLTGCRVTDDKYTFLITFAPATDHATRAPCTPALSREFRDTNGTVETSTAQRVMRSQLGAGLSVCASGDALILDSRRLTRQVTGGDGELFDMR